MQLDPDRRAVLELAAGGLTTPEIADRLGISLDLVRHRLAETVAALGVQSRLEAVKFALWLGLIDLPAPTLPERALALAGD